MLRPHVLVVAFLTLTAFACGSASEGEACDVNGFSCADPSAALECKAGRWVRLPCRGPGGCVKAQGVVKCDMAANVAGDACASTAEGKGLCSTSYATLECRDGVLVSNTCRSCTTSGEQVICQQ